MPLAKFKSSEAATNRETRVSWSGWCSRVVVRCYQEDSNRCWSRSTRSVYRDTIFKRLLMTGFCISAVDSSLGEIVPRLMTRFSSKEGYKLFDDSLPVRM